MNRTKWMQNAFTVSLLIMTSAVAARATVLRAYVSSTGDDVNTATNCPQTAPCKTFNAAIAVVTPGGELIALDSSGYGPITNINKSITIAAVPGAQAFLVVAAGTSGITVNGGVNDVVTLRNLHFNGNGAVISNGVRFNSGKALHLQDCIFTGLDRGIYDVAAPSLMNVDDSTFTNVHEGIFFEPSDSDVTHQAVAFIEHCRFANYFQGLLVAGRYTVVTVRDSHFTGRSKDNLITYGGIIAAPISVGTTHIMVENCLVANNYIGIGTKTDGVSFISVSQTVIYHNSIGVNYCCLSKIITFVNNRFEDNNDDGNFNLSTALK